MLLGEQGEKDGDRLSLLIPLSAAFFLPEALPQRSDTQGAKYLIEIVFHREPRQRKNFSLS
jgi:hypothetical protein